MNLDTFVKSQTFKTGVFVLLVLFVFMFVFKLGVLHGYKKVIFSDGHGFNKHRSVGNTHFGHQKSAFKKDMFANYSAKIELIKAKKLSGSAKEVSESEKEVIVE